MPRPSRRADRRQASAVAHAAHPRLSTARRIGRLCARTVLMLLLALLGALIYLHYLGMPRWVLDRWIRVQETHQRYLDTGRMSFNLFEGIVAHDFAYYETPQRVLPMLEADRVDLRIRVTDWLRGQSGWHGMSVEGGIIRVAPGGSLVQAEPDHMLTVSDLTGGFSWQEGQVTVRELSGDMLGFRFGGEGAVDLVTTAPGDRQGAITDGAALPPPSPGMQAWLRHVLAQLNRVEFDRPPELEVTFDLRPRDLAGSSCRFSGRGGGTLVRGVRFDQWQVEGRLVDGVLAVDKLAALHQEQALHAAGTYRLEDRELAGNLACDLPPAHWRSLIPVAWRDRMEAGGFIFSGPVSCTARFGPTTPRGIPYSLTGAIQAEQTEIRGLWLEHVRCRFTSDPEHLHLSEIETSVGPQGEHGRLRGQFDWGYADGRYQGAFASTLDFTGLAPILNEKQIRAARLIQLTDGPLAVQARFEGQRGVTAAFRAEGDVQGTNVVYRGAHINRGRARLTLSNRLVRLDDLHVERDEGHVDGLIQTDAERRVISLDLSGVMDGKAVGRVSGPTVDRILRNFEFGAPLEASVRGEIHLGPENQEHTRLQIHAAGDAIALRAFRSDHLRADILWTNQVVDVRAFDAEIYGGTLTGAYAIVMQGAEKPARYRLQATGRHLEFEEVVRTMAHREGEPYRGKISGTVSLDGVLGAGHGAEAVGRGSIDVEDGRIMRIPIFGGLSRGLSKIYSGLGFARQTDFTADFEVRNLYLHSTNAELEGDVFSLSGAGKYGIAEKTVDFDVEFKLLRGGNVGSVVRLVTLPITKLLKFDLEGTLEDPRWRPKNLPKELFGDFR